MEQKEQITTAPKGSDTLGAGDPRSIVPAVCSSSSNDGQNTVSAAGTVQALATAAIISERESETTNVVDNSMAECSASLTADALVRPRQGSGDTVIMSPSPGRTEEILSPMVPESWAKIVEDEEKASLANPTPQMDVDADDDSPSTRMASKRKKGTEF